jgi:hypothetical protein
MWYVGGVVGKWYAWQEVLSSSPMGWCSQLIFWRCRPSARNWFFDVADPFSPGTETKAVLCTIVKINLKYWLVTEYMDYYWIWGTFGLQPQVVVRAFYQFLVCLVYLAVIGCHQKFASKQQSYGKNKQQCWLARMLPMPLLRLHCLIS